MLPLMGRLIHRTRTAGLALALLLPSTLLAQLPEHPVSGTIVDEAGRALPGAEIARYFLYAGNVKRAYEPLEADGEGRFEGKIQPYKLPMTYMVLDRDRRLGALFEFTEKNVQRPVRIVLKPLAELSFHPEIEGGYELVNKATALLGVGTNLLLSYEPGPYMIPEGTYEIGFVSQELEKNARSFTIKAGQKLDLGPVSAKLTPVTRAIGKPAMPLEFAEARGLPADFKLADLKGKWVLIEFWGYW